MSFAPIHIEIATVAVAKSRAKRGPAGNAYIPKKTKNFEAELRWHWNLIKHSLLPVIATELRATIYLSRPARPKNKSKIPITKPDVDNYAKSIMDGLNQFAWRDDAQISDLIIRKRYTDQAPRVVIDILPTGESEQ